MMKSFKALAAGVVGAAMAATMLVAPATQATAVSATAGLPTTEPTRFYDFTGGIDADWTFRDLGFLAGGRTCSAPYADQAVPGSSFLALKAGKEKDAGIIAAQKDACKKALTAKKMSSSLKKIGKKFDTTKPIYRNAMLSTQGAFSMNTGTVAAKVKFPATRGMHGGIWLQSADGSEIDFIESYGYGKAVTSVVHTRYSSGKTKEHKLYSKKMKKSWFSKYHIFSVTWDTSKVSFRIDGKVVKSKKISTTGGSSGYFLVMSLLSSDWEQNKLPSSVSKGKSSGTMYVDWVKAWPAS